MSTTIKVEEISKEYFLGTRKINSLRESLSQTFSYTFRKQQREIFWALKNITFDLNEGDVLGIVGKNGAGKSTLLKILSRITHPTQGRFELTGRLASLLEVGTGFHPELTGRENIFLNGTLLGMKKKEIRLRFDEIVAFSGIDKFIDTPVKHYSSGMYVRLAFSVAAHLETDLLLVDEVLAVGDVAFQKKCLGKMKDISQSGKTVLFVSHNMAAVQSLSNKGLHLDNGASRGIQSIEEAVNDYLQRNTELIEDINKEIGIFNLSQHENKSYNSNFGLQEARLYCEGNLSNTLISGKEMKLEIVTKNSMPINKILTGFVINDQEGRPMIGINNKHLGQLSEHEAFNNGILTFTIPSFPLFGEGQYNIDLYWGNNEECFDIINHAIGFNLELSDIYKSAHILDKNLNKVVTPEVSFELKILDKSDR